MSNCPMNLNPVPLLWSQKIHYVFRPQNWAPISFPAWLLNEVSRSVGPMNTWYFWGCCQASALQHERATGFCTGERNPQDAAGRCMKGGAMKSDDGSCYLLLWTKICHEDLGNICWATTALFLVVISAVGSVVSGGTYNPQMQGYREICPFFWHRGLEKTLV